MKNNLRKLLLLLQHNKSANKNYTTSKGMRKRMNLFLTCMGVILSILVIGAIVIHTTKAAGLNPKGNTKGSEISLTESLTIYAGNTDRIKVKPADSEVQIKSYKSLNEKIATVSDGVVIAQAVGTTKVITTLVSDNKKFTHTTDITVKPGKVTITPLNDSVHVGEIMKLKTMVSCGVFNSLSYESDNTAVASVEKDGIYGIVTGKSEGRAVITVKVNAGGVITKNSIEIEVEKKEPQNLPVTNPVNGKNYTVKNEWKGSRVYFGEFEQDNILENGKEPILWRVLEITDNTVLLLSEYGLICKNYNDTFSDVTWETSTLRTWLNSTFLDSAFTNVERTAIQNTKVVNSDNSNYGTRGGNDTMDKVFLLSYDEAQNNAYGFQSGVSNKSKSRTMKLTEHALQEGYANKNNGNTCWWLRSPGITNQYAAYVFTVGSITDSYFVGRRNDAVRPVLRIKLSSVIFGDPIDDGTESYPVIIVK